MSNWKIIVGRERGGTTDVLKVLGCGRYYSYNRVFAVENLDSGELSEWVSDRLARKHGTWHKLSFEARAIGVQTSAEQLRKAYERSLERWNEDHPPKRCPDCYEGTGACPRGKHRPRSVHGPFCPWMHSGGGTPDPKQADDAEIAHLWPDGSYEVKA